MSSIFTGSDIGSYMQVVIKGEIRLIQLLSFPSGEINFGVRHDGIIMMVIMTFVCNVYGGLKTGKNAYGYEYDSHSE